MDCIGECPYCGAEVWVTGDGHYHCEVCGKSGYILLDDVDDADYLY